MSKVIKYGEREASPYIYPRDKQLVGWKKADRLEESEKIEDTYAEECIVQAVEQSEKILNTARKEGQLLKEEYQRKGYAQGYLEGKEDGFDQAKKEHLELFEKDRKEARKLLESCIEGMEQKKKELLEKYLDELKNIAVAIAEKVIRVSLRTSGETMKHMIASAAGELEKKEWAKVYVSKYDMDVMIEGDVEFLNTLSDLSSNVKIIKMENEEQGTCILELPDEIVDLSVNTQMANIRELLDNA